MSDDFPLPWGDFTVTCCRCGGTKVTVDNTLGFSSTSGSWGSVDIVCAGCDNTTSIVEAN